jgi:hypothetical protein
VEETPVEAPPPLSPSEIFKLEVQANARAVDGDQFANLMERILLTLADQWVMILALLAIVAGVYGFKGISDTWTTENQAQERIGITKIHADFAALRQAQARSHKERAKWYEDNPNALTSPEFTAPPAPDAFKATADAYKKLQDNLSTEGLKALAQLGEAGSSFEAATTAEAFAQVGKLYLAVGNNQAVEPLARSIAVQNAAISYERAAGLSSGEEAKKHWGASASSWAQLPDVAPEGKEVFGLFASVKQAHALNAQGDSAKALKVVEETQRAYESALKDPKNSRWNRALKLAHAQFK